MHLELHIVLIASDEKLLVECLVMDIRLIDLLSAKSENNIYRSFYIRPARRTHFTPNLQMSKERWQRE